MPPAPQSRDWSATFRQWAKLPSETEDQRASNVASMIRDAIRASIALQGRSVEVYASGSYRNKTNARFESDVDIAVVSHATFFHADVPAGLTFGPASYTFDEFRNDVETALRAKFGRGVTGGDKAFNVHENSYRLDADVAVFFPVVASDIREMPRRNCTLRKNFVFSTRSSAPILGGSTMLCR